MPYGVKYVTIGVLGYSHTEHPYNADPHSSDYHSDDHNDAATVLVIPSVTMIVGITVPSLTLSGQYVTDIITWGKTEVTDTTKIEML